MRLLALLLALVCAGCAKTVPVPVAIKRELPPVPKECTEESPAYPRVRAIKGGVIPPEEAAEHALRARQWADTIRAKRRVCGVYGRRMQTWR